MIGRDRNQPHQQPSNQQRLKYIGQWQEVKTHADGPWDFKRALETYQRLGVSFDRDRFSKDAPLVCEAVPWPVVDLPPVPVESVDWGAVEAFFTRAQQLMEGRSFVRIVEKSLLRFHVDRWRARGILKTVVDENERERLESGTKRVRYIV
ncbi:hypothetical protein V5O48_006966 [Marasmius crinis-equi]|uniref:Uncharacterized protein n=1 Tax=Marasmius crinis-equi TaxID=585013 RepID=A0ABR3FI28_9AGAR